MVTTTPVSRRRCPLCLAILSVEGVSRDGEVVRMEFDGHTPETCTVTTLQRIKVLEESALRDGRELSSQSKVIDDLGEWVGVASGILAAGRRWLGHRGKRMEDISRLRSAFGTQDRSNNNPLWAAEQEVADAIAAAVSAVEMRSKS